MADRPPARAPAVRQHRLCGASCCSEYIPTTLHACRWRALRPLEMPVIRSHRPLLSHHGAPRGTPVLRVLADRAGHDWEIDWR